MTRDFEDHDERHVIVEKSSSVMPFIIGVALGAGLALLFAPRSGAATRQRLKRRAARAARAARHAVEEVASDVRVRVEDEIDDARQVFEHKKAQVKLALDAGSVRSAKRSTRRSPDDLS